MPGPPARALVTAMRLVAHQLFFTTNLHFCARSSAILRISANNSNDARPTVSTRQTGQAHQLQTCRAHTQMSASRPISQHLNSAQICYLCQKPYSVSSPEPSAEQACYNLSTLLLTLFCYTAHFCQQLKRCKAYTLDAPNWPGPPVANMPGPRANTH